MALADSDGKKNKSYGKAALKAKAKHKLVADVSASDLKILKKYNKKQDIDTIKTIEPGLSKGKHGISDKEIKDVISGKIKEPTGIHKKK